jgi:hypothetical protein
MVTDFEKELIPSVSLKMKAADFFVTLVITYQITCCYDPKDHNTVRSHFMGGCVPEDRQFKTSFIIGINVK